MAKFLFTAWPFAGHLHPCLAIAHALRSRGHEVAFYTGASACADIQSEGFRCFPFIRVNEERIKTIASSEIPYCPTVLDRLKNARLLKTKFKEWLLDTVPGQVEDLHAILESWRPEAVVGDLSLWAPFLVLHERHRIPVAVISIFAACLLPGPDAPPWGNGKPRPRTALMRTQSWLQHKLMAVIARRFLAEVNALRARYSLDAIPCSVTEYAGRMPMYLVPSAPEYDYERKDLPPSVHYVGPLLWDKPKEASAPAWLASLPGERPLLYITEATVGTQEPFLLKVAHEAFRDEPFDVVMTTGKQREAGVCAALSAANIRVEPYIPQSDLLPKVSVMITLGGSGGVLAALQAGVPLVVVPTEWDRPENAQRVVEAGAGLRLHAERLTPQQLRAAVKRVLNEPSFRFNAQRLAKIFTQRGGPIQAATLLERLTDPFAQRDLSLGVEEAPVTPVSYRSSPLVAELETGTRTR